ncbi:uncharacterized protein LOC141854919 [Brevipalpus obovatus]|uniref:uncharacterized protein LOC141854919 n=1 Tax=Brevipalpus obovatus TaxID=246614 RepID=UPI003D9DBB72
MLKISLIFLCLTFEACYSQNRDARLRRQAQTIPNLRYRLSAGSETVLAAVREEFSCEGRDYGYYADLANECQIFHICVPPNGHYTFFCGNQTIFDQRLLTCQDVRRATPCNSAEQYYVLNQNFGVLDQDQYVRV